MNTYNQRRYNHQSDKNKPPDFELVEEFSTLGDLCTELLLRSIQVQLNIWNKGKLYFKIWQLCINK